MNNLLGVFEQAWRLLFPIYPAAWLQLQCLNKKCLILEKAENCQYPDLGRFFMNEHKPIIDNFYSNPSFMLRDIYQKGTCYDHKYLVDAFLPCERLTVHYKDNKSPLYIETDTSMALIMPIYNHIHNIIFWRGVDILFMF